MRNLPTSTYRIQLRNGVDFAAVQRWLPALDDLGISHLYLSPVQTATTGSTHGYDVTDPTEVDPVLGGRKGLERLSKAAAKRGMGIVLDIVPNHTAFTTENPWLRDVLRRGEASPFARHFDIDWTAGPLVLPFLTEPFPDLAAKGALKVDEAGDGPVLRIGDLEVPLSFQTVLGDPPDWEALHEAQVWRLTPWRHERDGVTHRRFFNITQLIGMCVEEPEVFDATHALILDLLDKGVVHGLRVDHVDGLVDPAGYLRRLRSKVGEAPIWVEKILVGDERLPPDWPVEGTTGYEAAAALVSLLSDADGVWRLRAAWAEDTDRRGDFESAVREAKGTVIRQELAAELHQLIALARAVSEEEGRWAGEEVLRETVIALLVEMPRYRTYFFDGDHAPGDRELLFAAAERAEAAVFDPSLVRPMAHWIADAPTEATRLFRLRFQQVSGALIAKAQEDTAFFRWTANLAACEVGAEPDRPILDAAAFDRWCAGATPTAMTLGSTHDTKRAEDARLRLAAATHRPGDLIGLVAQAARLPEADAVDPVWRWYIVQALLAMWEAERDDLGERLETQVLTAARHGKEITLWTRNDEEAEQALTTFAAALLAAWREALPDEAARIHQATEPLILAQVALRLTMPGIPDIYQGCEATSFLLGDPDNRLPVDPRALKKAKGLAAKKRDLTRTLLHLRRETPALFAEGEVRVRQEAGTLVLERAFEDERLVVRLLPEGEAEAGEVWPAKGATAVTVSRA